MSDSLINELKYLSVAELRDRLNRLSTVFNDYQFVSEHSGRGNDSSTWARVSERQELGITHPENVKGGRILNTGAIISVVKEFEEMPEVSELKKENERLKEIISDFQNVLSNIHTTSEVALFEQET